MSRANKLATERIKKQNACILPPKKATVKIVGPQASDTEDEEEEFVTEINKAAKTTTATATEQQLRTEEDWDAEINAAATATAQSNEYKRDSESKP
jgi:CO dehydrogenase/acetyl-CoA synthase epsilon subunit